MLICHGLVRGRQEEAQYLIKDTKICTWARDKDFRLSMRKNSNPKNNNRNPTPANERNLLIQKNHGQ